MLTAEEGVLKLRKAIESKGGRLLSALWHGSGAKYLADPNCGHGPREVRYGNLMTPGRGFCTDCRNVAIGKALTITIGEVSNKLRGVPVRLVGTPLTQKFKSTWECLVPSCRQIYMATTGAVFEAIKKGVTGCPGCWSRKRISETQLLVMYLCHQVASGTTEWEVPIRVGGSICYLDCVSSYEGRARVLEIGHDGVGYWHQAPSNRARDKRKRAAVLAKYGTGSFFSITPDEPAPEDVEAAISHLLTPDFAKKALELMGQRGFPRKMRAWARLRNVNNVASRNVAYVMACIAAKTWPQHGTKEHGWVGRVLEPSGRQFDSHLRLKALEAGYGHARKCPNRRRGISGYRGVSKRCDGRWVVRKNSRSLPGAYLTPKEAAQAYDVWMLKEYGPTYPHFNFPPA